MDVKEMNVVMEGTITTNVTTGTTTTGSTITTKMTKPTAIITQIASKEYLKILELTEYCKMAQFTLKECECKIQTLVSAKNETAKLKMEYITRDKINITNSESLLQAKNELFQFKSELKSHYVAIEKAAKTKKLKYEKLISSYEADWRKALEKYKSNSLVTELDDIQRTNTAVEENIQMQERLTASTKSQMSKLYSDLKETFVNKILEFSKTMIAYNNFLKNQKINREKCATEDSRKLQANRLIKLSKSLASGLDKGAPLNEDSTTCFSTVDVSVFDELMVPSENLETQNEEEELFHFIQNQYMHAGEDHPGEDESPEMLVNDDHQSDEQVQNKMQINEEGGLKEDSGKGGREEDESHYFRIEGTECSKQRTMPNAAAENWDHLNECGNKTCNEISLELAGNLKGTYEKNNLEGNIEQGKQFECEKSMSEASYDHQNSFQRENFEYIYTKTPSVSSEEIPLFGENTNESFGSPRKVMTAEHTDIFKLENDQEQGKTKSFQDFFAMGRDKDSAKPSIFKLF